MPIRQAHDQKPFGPEFTEGQLTAGRSEFPLNVTSTSPLQSKLALACISSRLPASLVRFTSSRSRTPAVFLRSVWMQPTVKTWWTMRRMFFAPGFRKYVENCKEAPAAPTFGELVQTEDHSTEGI